MSRRYEWEREVAVEAVREAARLCRAVGAEISPEVLAKKDKSPVTVADFGSQALIARALGEAFPDDPIIAEEDSAELREPGNAAILDQVLRHVRVVRGGGDTLDAGEVCRWIDRGGTSEYSDRFWTLDPIDGTKGFLRGEQYAVALALVLQGEVVVAALACPGLDAVFYAVRGEGAFVVPMEAEAQGEHRPPVQIRVSDRDDPSAVRFCESVESGQAPTGMPRPSPIGWGSRRPRSAWTARPSMPSSRGARPTSISGSRPAPTTARRSGTTPPAP